MKKTAANKIFFFLTSLTIIFTSLKVRADGTGLQDIPSGIDVTAEGYCILDTDTGKVLAGKNALNTFYPASTTKVLTGLIACENIIDISKSLTYSASAVNEISGNSTTMPNAPCAGETMSIKDSLYGMLLSSCNISANAIAEYVAGSCDNFAVLMNEKAAEIGAKNSHFVNAHGLHNDDHYTTPYDLALIFSAALKNPLFKEIDSTLQYSVPPTNMYAGERRLVMGHKIVSGEMSFEGVYAGKTGRTFEAGRTLLTAASHSGKNIVISIMKTTEDEVYTDAEILLEYAYNLIDGKKPFELTEFNAKGTIVKNVNMRKYPSIYAPVVSVIEEGKTGHVLGRYREWICIQIEDKTGFISADYLNLVIETTECESTKSNESTLLNENNKS